MTLIPLVVMFVIDDADSFVDDIDYTGQHFFFLGALVFRPVPVVSWVADSENCNG